MTSHGSTRDSTYGEFPWSEFAEYRPISVGGYPTSLIAAADVKRIVAHDGGSDFDRSEHAVIELNDGRFVGWESWSDVTGSGFHGDAYGGDVEVWFARSVAELRPMFSEQAWEGLKL
jgi:hypothetical protein